VAAVAGALYVLRRPLAALRLARRGGRCCGVRTADGQVSARAPRAHGVHPGTRAVLRLWRRARTASPGREAAANGRAAGLARAAALRPD